MIETRGWLGLKDIIAYIPKITCIGKQISDSPEKAPYLTDRKIAQMAWSANLGELLSTDGHYWPDPVPHIPS